MLNRVAPTSVQVNAKNEVHLPPWQFLLDFSSPNPKGSKKNGPVFYFQLILTRFWRSYCPKHGENSLILVSGPKNGAMWQLCAPTQAPVGLSSAKKAWHWATQA